MQKRDGPTFIPRPTSQPTQSFCEKAWQGIKRNDIRADSANSNYALVHLPKIGVAQMRNAVEQLHLRYPVISLCVKEQNERPWLMPSTNPSDISVPHFCNSSSLAEVEARIGNSIWRDFDVESGPLSRFFLVNHAVFGCHIAFVVHSFIADAVSLQILARELKFLCETMTEPSAQLQAPGLPYLDYLDGINNWMDTKSGREALEVALASLKNLPQVDYVRDGADPQIEKFEMDASVFEAFRAAARELNTSPFNLLLSVQMIILSALSGQARTAVKVISNGRTSTTTARIVGRIADSVYVTTDVSRADTFDALIVLCQQSVTNALKNAFIKDDHLHPGLVAAGLRTDMPVFNYIVEPDGLGRTPAFGARPQRLRVPPPPDFPPRRTTTPYYLKILDDGHRLSAVVQFGSGKINGFSKALTAILIRVSANRHEKIAVLLRTAESCLVTGALS